MEKKVAVKKNINYSLTLVIFLPLLMACNHEKEKRADNKLKCETEIKTELIFSNSIEVDISNGLDLIKDQNLLYIASYTSSLLGEIYSYNIDTKQYQKISSKGRGPFEFSGPLLFKKDRILYIHDLYSAKVAEYSLDKKEFTTEYSFDRIINGPIITAKNTEEGKLLYFLNSRRDRSISNDTYYDLLVYDVRNVFLDTILTFKDETRLNNFNSIKKSDLSLDYPVYNYKTIGELDGQLIVAESHEFAIRSLYDSVGIDSKVKFNYSPDYENYVQSIIDRYSKNSITFLSQVKNTIENSSKDYNSLYKSILFGDSTVLYGLFSEDNLYLLHNIDKAEAKVLCADINMKPMLIEYGEIYWHLRDEENHIYELRKSKISEL